jgi:crotonobetainyl-CoA:carnitine CoA-transferase CaiB-like acyl-CoA transferase
VVAGRPLADVTVLSVEQFGAGPWGTLQLADLGADVIKIEDPGSGGDVSRYVPPFQEGEDSLFFETFNRNKRSISLDLRTGAGREVFEELVGHADAVYSNLRGDQPARLGLTYAALAPVNPRIVCCALTGFGTDGPRAKEGGYDYVVQGLAGWMSLTGDPDGPPTKSGLSLVDLSAGYAAALALMAGLWRARRDGVGCDCDVSLFEVALAQLCYVGTWAATGEFQPRRMPDSAHPSIVPFQAFEAADGWIVVACPKQKFWERLCVEIGLPELLEDPRFADFAGRDRHRDELLPVTAGRPAARFGSSGSPPLRISSSPPRSASTPSCCPRPPHARRRRLHPVSEQVEWAENTLAALAEGEREGRGAVASGGTMIDEPVAAQARGILARRPRDGG